MKQRIRSGFNLLAPVYDALTYVFSFNSIYRSQTFFLTKRTKVPTALIFGGGPGSILLAALKNKVAEKYCYIDISDKMIESAQHKLSEAFSHKSNDVQFICGSYNDVPDERQFDLIITPYILDCFTDEELPIVMDKLNQHLKHKGKWLFTDFDIPKSGNNKIYAQLVLHLLYFLFNVICGLGVNQLPDFKREFERLGYKVEDEKYFFGRLLVARVYQRD